jgi:drug/metabolite transporter (DMT)-like permease
MIFLILSILFSAYISVIFVVFNRFKIDLFQTIVVNYGVCVLTGSIVLGRFPIHVQTLSQPIFSWSMLMGALFIAVFNLIAISSVRVGVTITQTANKLSLVIPVGFSFFFYHENISWLKLAGIFIALLAVILVSAKNKVVDKKIQLLELCLPILLFVGSGIIDTLTKYVQRTYLSNNEIANMYLISGFLVAFSIGLLILMVRILSGTIKFQWRSVVAGLLLGVPNYFSIYFLIKALQSPSLNSSAMIPINNIGILFVVSLIGIFFFREKLSFKNCIGLVCTLLAILCIYYGDQF